MSAWSGELPALGLVLAALVLPGLLVGLAMALRPLDALGAAPALSVGVLGVADLVAMQLGRDWGVGTVAWTTAALLPVGMAVGGLSLWWSRRGLGRGPVREQPRRPHWGWTLGSMVVAPLAAAAAVARGIGAPNLVNQTYDSPFHVNAIALVIATHSDSPATVESLGRSVGGPGFYPPLFHGLAALPGMALGTSPVVAANVTAVVMAAVWPLSVSLLLRRLIGPGLGQLLIGMLGSVVVTVFPVMLLVFGVLWPNTLSLLVLPAALALVARLVGMVRDPGGLGWPSALAAVLLMLPGMYLAHPGAAFALALLCLPMVVEAELRLVRRAWSGTWQIRSPRRAATMVVAGTGLALLAGWLVLYTIPSLNAVRHFGWAPRETLPQAVGEVLFLGTPVSSPNIAYGVLALSGIIWCLRTGRYVWLAVLHVVIGVLAALAASTASGVVHLFTGFWYNDSYRVLAMVGVTTPVLAALGARPLLDWLTTAGRRQWALSWVGQRGRRWAARLVFGLGIWVLGVGLVPLSHVERSVARDYDLDQLGPGSTLVSEDDRTVYEDLRSQVPAGGIIAGNPWTGEAYAGVLSGHPVLWPQLAPENGADEALLAEHFRDFTTDPRVCAAVQRLHVAVVVTNSSRFWASDPRSSSYPGFDDLDGVAGLTLIERQGTAAAYRVGACHA